MLVRREKLATYQEQGLNPFGGKFVRTAMAQEMHDSYAAFSKEELETKDEEVTIAGRVMTKRGKGKVGFAHLQDSSGQVQIYVRKDEIGEEAYDVFKTIDIGEIVGVTGIVFKTNVGELCVIVKEFQLFTKSLRRLTENNYGRKDVEQRYRK